MLISRGTFEIVHEYIRRCSSVITRNWETLPAVVLTLSIRSEFSQRLSLLSHFRSTLPSRPNKKVLPYSLPSVGPGADPGVQAVSPQVT